MAVKLQYSSASPRSKKKQRERVLERTAEKELGRVELTEFVRRRQEETNQRGLKRPRNDDKNLPRPTRISLTIRGTAFGFREWVSRRVMRS